MIGERHERSGWGRSFAGGLIGSLVATPALALPPDLPMAFDDDMRLYVLIGSGILLFAALVMRLIRNKDKTEVDGGVVDEVAQGYRKADQDPRVDRRALPLELQDRGQQRADGRNANR